MISLAAVVAAFAVRCLRADELHCENAVAQLEKCCPDFKVEQDYCVYKDAQCNAMFGWDKVYPAISEDDARCIVRASCTELLENGTCARAMEANAYRLQDPQYRSSGICK